jgi:hypothetical protein
MAPETWPTGPFDTREQARDAVRGIYAIFHEAEPPSGPVNLKAANLALLTEAVNIAGIGTGDYDERILDWLAGWEPEICAVIAGLIIRAASTP